MQYSFDTLRKELMHLLLLLALIILLQQRTVLLWGVNLMRGTHAIIILEKIHVMSFLHSDDTRGRGIISNTLFVSLHYYDLDVGIEDYV